MKLLTISNGKILPLKMGDFGATSDDLERSGGPPYAGMYLIDYSKQIFTKGNN